MGTVVERLASAKDDSASPQMIRAYRSPVAWIRLLSVLILCLTVDLGSKWWSFASVGNEPIDPTRIPVPPPPGIRVLPGGLLDLQLVANHGAVFGIGANQRFFFIAFTLAALIVGLFVFGKFTRPSDRLAHVAIGLILAGGVGNLYDRIVYGVVRDFLHMLPDYHLPFGWSWPGGSPEIFPWVFNAADVMLLTGMGLLMLHMGRKEAPQPIPAAGEAANSSTGP